MIHKFVLETPQSLKSCPIEAGPRGSMLIWESFKHKTLDLKAQTQVSQSSNQHKYTDDRQIKRRWERMKVTLPPTKTIQQTNVWENPTHEGYKLYTSRKLRKIPLKNKSLFIRKHSLVIHYAPCLLNHS